MAGSELHFWAGLAHNTVMQRLASILGLRRHDLRRFIIALGLLLLIVVVGMIGYSLLADLDLIETFYMTVITVSTVGFGEIGDFDDTTRLFSSLLIIFTIIWGAWALQSVLGTFLSPEFRMGVHQIRSVRRAQKMENHTIICGYGRIGRSAAAELSRNDQQFVVIESDLDLVEQLREAGVHVVQGDATEDETLLSAGIEQAENLLSVLSSDNANIVTVLSARELNPNLWISSRVVEPEAARKLRRAGADEVVSPYDFGGRRLALTALRPHVTEFLSQVIFDEGRGAEMDEIPVVKGSDLADRTLGEIDLRKRFGIIVIALYHTDSEKYREHGGFELNPGSQTSVHVGDVLIVVGRTEELRKVHEALGV